MQIKIAIQDADVKALLQRLKDKVGNLKPAMDEIGQRYERSVLENFANESSPDGTPWKPLKAQSIAGQYKKSKKKLKGGIRIAYQRYLDGKKILVNKGTLRDRVKYQATRNSMTIGSTGAIKYAAVHQFGSRADSKNKIPARPWLAINVGSEQMDLAPKDKAMVLEVLERHLADAIK
jgi:phage virion morphogenesis protein